MTKRILAIFLLGIMAIGILTGCGENTNFLTGEPEVEMQTRSSNEIHIPIEKVRTLNPIITKDEDAFYMNKLIYQSLFEFDENLTLRGMLADGYTYENNKASVRINLKKNIKWEDGEEFTAEDVKFSIESHMRAASTGNSMYASNVSNIKSVSLVRGEPYQVIVHFISTDKVSMADFTFPMVPQHQYRSVDNILRQAEEFICIGMGPYKITEYNELTHIRMEGNELYHGETPGNILNFRIMPDKSDAVNLMEVSDLAISFSKEIDRDTAFAHKDVDIVSFASNEVEFVGFNNQVLTDKRIRQAIAYSIDRELILGSGYFSNGILNDNIYYPNYLGVKSSDLVYKMDIEKAKQLLIEAGYIDRDGDGIAENVNDQELTINILVNSENQSRVAAAQIIKTGLERLPIRSNLIIKSWDEYNSDLAGGNFDIYISGFQINESYDLRPFLHSGYENVIGYTNLNLDALLDQMSMGLTNEEKVNTFITIKEILIEDLPYFCLLYKTYGAITSPALQGEVKPLFNDLYNGCESWSYVYEVVEEAK
jgi:peptide/nickel transport system substrate-binding protein